MRSENSRISVASFLVAACSPRPSRSFYPRAQLVTKLRTYEPRGFTQLPLFESIQYDRSLVGPANVSTRADHFARPSANKHSPNLSRPKAVLSARTGARTEKYRVERCVFISNKEILSISWCCKTTRRCRYDIAMEYNVRHVARRQEADRRGGHQTSDEHSMKMEEVVLCGQAQKQTGKTVDYATDGNNSARAV